jgi:hypothetical protein
MTRGFRNNGEEAAGRRVEVLLKKFFTGGQPLLPSTFLHLNSVIPNSDNHPFTCYDLILKSVGG